jgi:long-chain acyl-CoA synthetase
MTSTVSHTSPDFETVSQMFWHGVRRWPAATMMRQKDLGLWQAHSWQEVGDIVADVAAALAALGLQPGDVVSILSNTNRQWVWTDLGALTAGGIVSGIYPTDAASQLEYLCSDSATHYLFVEDEEQLDKYLQVRDRLPLLRKVVVYDMKGLRGFEDPQVMSFEALLALGRDTRKQRPGLVAKRLASRAAADTAVLVYTSGTTGRPKGAMLSHGNLVASCLLYREALGEHLAPGWDRVAFLPLCHVAERVGGEYMAILTGQVLNFVENPETVVEDMREVQPVFFTAVPRVWEKLYSATSIAIKEASKLQQWAYGRALAVGMDVAAALEAWRRPGPWLRLRYWLARKLVLDNLRRAMGIHSLRFGVTGAAPISPELIRWFTALGVDMREVWGMTECSGAATVTRERPRPGSIGQPLPGTELRISAQGELLLRGPTVFQGYLNLPEKTAETLVDGWLRTGDAGRVDADGFFFITDRIKDIIITAGGKNITPSEWENQLKFSPYITDAVVIGDRRPYLTCLVMIDHENVEQWAQQSQVQFSDYRSLCRSRGVQALIQSEIDKANRQFARVEQVKQFRLIENKLTPEDEELTPTMKLKRKLVSEKYKDLIESMYRGAVAT